MEESRLPELVSMIHWKPKVHFIAAGALASYCVTEDGLLYSWGNGKYGQLGLGGRESVHTPTLIQKLAKIKMEKIVAGEHHVIALSSKLSVAVNCHSVAIHDRFSQRRACRMCGVGTTKGNLALGCDGICCHRWYTLSLLIFALQSCALAKTTHCCLEVTDLYAHFSLWL